MTMASAPLPVIEFGLLPTPFHARLNALMRTHSWEEWGGFLSPLSIKCVEREYFAIRNAASVFDLSPMCKYRISGPDAEQVLNRLVTRNVRKIKPGRVGYALWCDEEGMLIADGTIFRIGASEFLLLSQERNYSWLLDTAWGYDVSIVDETESLCGLALQGPTAFSVLKEAGLGQLSDMKPFDIRFPEQGLMISRTGFTGDLGYELFVRPEMALDLWDRLFAGGENWGITAIGAEALYLARVEAGFLLPEMDFQPVHTVERVGRGRTPFELGFGNLVHFDKGHFNGRRALLRHQAAGPRVRLVRLDIEGKDPAVESFVYVGKETKVGHITSAMWSPTLKRNIALAEIDARFGDPGFDGLWVEIDVEKEGRWLRREMKAKVVSEPFLKNPRSRKTPAGPF